MKFLRFVRMIGEVFGDHSSFEKRKTMERFLIFSHIFSGGLVLLLGIVNFLNRKGARNHILTGRIYVGAMWWICLSALLVISFYRFSFFLLVISVITFYSSFVGVRVLRRKQVGSETWYDILVAWLTALFGVGLFGYGIYLFLPFDHFSVIGILSIIFGFVTFRSGYVDLKFFYKKPETVKSWWLGQHINAISGSYVAALTAFAVLNSRLFLPNESYQWLAWILPGVLATPVISFMQRKYVPKKPQALTKSATTV